MKISHVGRLVHCGAGIAVAALLVLGAAKTPAGIQGSGLQAFSTIGSVTQIGSSWIVVGGAQYITGGAQFEIDGQPGRALQIQVGDVVSVHGMAPGGGLAYIATDVIFSGNVRGRVRNIDPAASTFQVLGQTVRVDSQTLFGARDFAALQEGDEIEASGFPDSTGALRALRIDPAAVSDPARVVGTVQNLNQQRMTFQINSLTVSYGGTQVNGLLAEGATVTAEGSASPDGAGLVANTVNVQRGSLGTPGVAGRIEGLVTALDSNTYFEVDGQPVEVNAQTHLSLRNAPLQLNATVRVSGTFDDNGVLVASQVQTEN
jgi:Domain of unknown function (DUF5666)